MGFMDKLKEAKEKASAILDQAAANRAQMQAIEEAANDPTLIAKVQDAETMGYVYADTIERPFDKNWTTVYGLKDSTILLYHKKVVDDATRSYITEFTMRDVDEVRLDYKKGNSYSFHVVLKNNTIYRLCITWKRSIDLPDADEKIQAMTAKEGLEDWIHFFRVVWLLIPGAKEEETRTCFNDILVESGGEAVFVPGVADVDYARIQAVCEELWDQHAEEYLKARKVCAAMGVL